MGVIGRADYGQCLEILLSAIYHRSVMPGDTVIDGGAAGGLHTIPLGRLAKPNGRVYAYEAQPGLEALQRWADYDGLSQVCFLRNVAIGALSGEMRFYRNVVTPELSSAKIMDSNTGNWTEIQVPVVCIDDEQIEGKCSFIKLDLEGGERDALIGASRLIDRDRPVIAFENGIAWAARKFNYEAGEFLDFFQKKGYEVYDFAGTKVDPGNLLAEELVSEFVAFHKDDARKSVIIDTISEFNSRLSCVEPAKDWQGVIARVQQPFSSGFWVAEAATSDSKCVFGTIYERGWWGSEESKSGRGSELAATDVFRAEFEAWLGEHPDVTSVLDAPCGDFNWMRVLKWPYPVRYVGGDVVPEIVAELNARHAGLGRQFCEMDIIEQDIPDADLWLCRDAMIHFSFAQGARVVSKFLTSRTRYLLATTFPSATNDTDCELGRYHQVNLALPPFALGPPERLLRDPAENNQTDRFIGVWSNPRLRTERGAISQGGAVESGEGRRQIGALSL